MNRWFGLVLVWLVASGAVADDWPQFRGPNGSGVSSEASLPVEWSKSKNIRWKAPLPGQGHSSPVIAGGRIYLTATSGFQEDRLHVLCLDQISGKELWQRQFQATGSTRCNPKSNMAVPTPVTDGKAVFALFGTGDLAALDAEGDLLWCRSLAHDYRPPGNVNGMSASLLLWRDILIVPMDNIGASYLLGVDVKSGKNCWKTARPRAHNWATPLLVPQGDHAQVVIGSVTGFAGYDARSGKELWALASSGFSNIATPVLGDGLIIAPGGQVAAFRAGLDRKAPREAWQANKLHPNISSPLCYEKRVYAVNPPNVLACADASNGKLLWQERLPEGTYWSSPVAADGKVYVVNDAGVTTVLASGDRPKVLAVNDLDDPILATPALAGGCVILRSSAFLYCIGPGQERVGGQH